MNMRPLAELRNFLCGWGRELRNRRDYRAVIEVEALEDITKDAISHQSGLAQAAYTAEQADLEASRIIAEALEDGRVTANEIPKLRCALRHVLRSAEHDHQIADRAACRVV